MKIACDHCARTANGSRDDLINVGWCKIIVTNPFRRTFTGCPEHTRLASAAAFAAIDNTGGRRILEKGKG